MYERSFARLGIFKFNGDEKGIVQDAPIVHVENHNAYANRKNDIAILYLKHDVEITGEHQVNDKYIVKITIYHSMD